jgi:HAD superfamily hydrolase (TIGR01549 family)
MYKAFLFDMDGTIVDTFDLIYESFNAALLENNKKTLTKRDFDKKLFGKPVDSTLHRLVGTTTLEETRDILKSFEKYWLRNLHKVKVFKNVPLTLDTLKSKGYKLGVVSTSPRDVISETLRQTGIYDYFDVLIGEEDAEQKKPHHEPVTNALRVLRLKARDAVFVGDTVYDIRAGKSAGCRTVFLLNKYNEEVLDKEKPDRVIKDVSELIENGK